jgi:hypothetical protein
MSPNVSQKHGVTIRPTLRGLLPLVSEFDSGFILVESHLTLTLLVMILSLVV